MTTNRIIWRKWSDPLAPLVKGGSLLEDEDDTDFHDAIDSFGFHDEPGFLRLRDGKVWPVVVGPMGIIPLHESNLPSALFNFWMGDTNFDLSPGVVEAIERVPGVETLDIFTRYRFRLGIGRAFNEAEVKKAVEQVVQPAQPKAASPLDGIKKMLSRMYSHWAIFVLPGGKYEYAGGGSIEEVTQKAKKYGGVAERTILSWEK